MAYGLTPTTDSSATGAEFQPPQNSSAGSGSYPAKTSNGRRLVEVEPASNTSSTSPTGFDPRQRASLDQRTSQWLEEVQSFTGLNVPDVNRAASSVATTAESEPSQYCESEGTGYSAPTYVGIGSFVRRDAVSSDEDVSHLKVAHASPANTGKVFEKNGKIPVEFIKEMANLVLEKERFKPEELSQLKEDQNALLKLLIPNDVEDEHGKSYSIFINSEGFEVEGVPDPESLKEYTLKPDIEPKVKTVYSFMEETVNRIESFYGFGILESGHPFKFQLDVDNSNLGNACDPCITIAPDWNSMIDNLHDYDLKYLLENMNKCNSKLLDDWLKITPSCSLNDVRDKLKIVLSPDLLNMFCQRVFKMINH
ncbi:hypothetical protein [Endozoicomonas sp. 2B-B]